MTADESGARGAQDARGLVSHPDWAAAAHNVVLKNKDKDGRARRHAIAFAFVYALLELADAVRGRDDG